MKIKVCQRHLLLILGIIFYCPSFLPAQTSIEEILLEENNRQEASDILDQLQQFRQHPLDLNTASYKKLQTLPILSPVIARKIIRERKRNGLFVSASDIRKRLNIDKEEWDLLKSFVTLSKTRKKKTGRTVQLRWRLREKFPLASGYRNDVYPGTPLGAYQRLLVSPNSRLRGGLLLEKDPGEDRWTDHLVGFLQMDLGNAGRFTAGHFRAEFGQGLVLWGPYGCSRGADPIAVVKKRSREISGYTYSDESSYLTGGAWQKSLGICKGSIFFSSTLLDATLHEDGTVRSFTDTGYHRTGSELAKRHRVRETMLGGRLALIRTWMTLGITGWWNRYSCKIDPKDPERYFFHFHGDRNQVLGLDFDFFISEWNLSGEIARSRSGGWAGQVNGMTRWGKWKLALSVHHYEAHFQNPHSLGFGSDDTQNQEGIYIGLTGKPARSARLNLFYDLSRRPWRTYGTPVPTRGSDLFVQWDQTITSRISMILRARLRHGEDMNQGILPSGQESGLLRNRYHHLIRGELQIQLFSWIQLNSRVETASVTYPASSGKVWAPESNEPGFLFFLHMKGSLSKAISVTARWTCFQTGSYDSRIYAYEHDLPGVLTIRPLYGRGIRWFVLIKGKPFRGLTVSFKYSRMTRYGVCFLGSGYDRMEGNREHQLGFQIDMTL